MTSAMDAEPLKKEIDSVEWNESCFHRGEKFGWLARELLQSMKNA